MGNLNTKRHSYPFHAIVGQDAVKLSLLLNTVSIQVGGVLIQGERGNAKSTAVRALRKLMPLVPFVPGCSSHCDPAMPFEFCPHCKGEKWDGPVEYAEAPFVELPLSATEDRLSGHLNMEAALRNGIYTFQPGLLAQAHRGILYVDEINLLPDHLIDALLDAAASGWNHVEREGFSVSHPARFILVGTMNPEEGELRPQLVDRFGLSVPVITPKDIEARTSIMSRRMQFEANPEQFIRQWEVQEKAVGEQLSSARIKLPDVELPQTRLEQIARICIQAGTEGVRADLVLCEAAKALAAYRNHPSVTVADVNDAAPLVLYHRSTEQWQPDPDDSPPEDYSGDESSRNNDNGNPNNGDSGQSGQNAANNATPSYTESETASQPQVETNEGQGPSIPAPIDEQLLPIDSLFRIKDAALDQVSTKTSPIASRNFGGGRTRTRANGVNHPLRGRYLRSQSFAGGKLDTSVRFDWQKTLAAAIFQPKLQNKSENHCKIKLGREHLYKKTFILQHKQFQLYAIDASGSMSSYMQMKQAKAAILSMIQKAYPKRYVFGIVSFRNGKAEVLLPPTKSVKQAKHALEQLRNGGTTPLAKGLRTCLELLQRWGKREPSFQSSIFVFTDGKVSRSSHSVNHETSLEAALHLAEKIAQEDFCATIIDTENGRIRLGLARLIASTMKASYVRLDDLKCV
ncbi:hypothetical protein ASG89_23165 [Paenibacillus sp. Soil766]|uniref:VWA domain-containing protein n=1 Tax=Paenibacillus sp. Soil766 TaxID=1736404 RepID=UPI00070C40C1|nr:VWA domain-containing protein [Paenibacillus sp. Soil766]KRF03346.1 hypothetical protein ASG89_23165 [Paenibacillus sp. Soil766]